VSAYCMQSIHYQYIPWESKPWPWCC